MPIISTFILKNGDRLRSLYRKVYTTIQFDYLQFVMQ